ncbi:MAG: hypothetical protein IJU52_07800 [Clostridia bacterium]|nr:hypothetical protein [Clostridia bacterium]
MAPKGALRSFAAPREIVPVKQLFVVHFVGFADTFAHEKASASSGGKRHLPPSGKAPQPPFPKGCRLKGALRGFVLRAIVPVKQLFVVHFVGFADTFAHG